MDTAFENFNGFVFDKIADSRIYNWPLMARPYPVMGIILIYLICVKKLLPAFMANRPAYNLKRIIAAYNIFQVIACCILIYGTLTSGWTTHYTLGCQCVDYSTDKMAVRMAGFIWWTFMLKIVELTETIFFCLRKKFNQVSTLHVYHHASSVFCGWLGCKYGPGGVLSMTILLNCSVHVIMYSYYYLSSLGPEMQKKLVWVKPRITQIQVLQLFLLAGHFAQTALPSCKCYSAWYPGIYLGNMIINILFFINFYRNSYLKKKV